MSSIILDERLHPNLKMIAEMLALVVDSDGDDHEFYKEAFRLKFAPRKKDVQWTGGEPQVEDIDRSQATIASKDIIKGYMSNILGEE